MGYVEENLNEGYSDWGVEDLGKVADGGDVDAAESDGHDDVHDDTPFDDTRHDAGGILGFLGCIVEDGMLLIAESRF